MSKGKSQALGITAMIVVLVVVVALSTVAMRYVFRNMSGFQDAISGTPIQVPSGPQISDTQVNYPDKNTGYLCRSPNGSGQPCDEGQFCDGPSESCLPTYVGSSMPGLLPGYFS